jgi:feruloyl esterase
MTKRFADLRDENGTLIYPSSFYRLCMGTGMAHCGGGVGPNAVGGAFGSPAPVRDAEHDVIEALAAWIENGRAPEQVIATRCADDGSVGAQRPWCAYPASAVWDGTGDRSRPASYRCEAR